MADSRRPIWRGVPRLVLLVLAACFGCDDKAPSRQTRIAFSPAVTNTEYLISRLSAEPPPQVRRAPDLGESSFFGTIMRRLPGDGLQDTSHYVSFAVRYDGNVAVQATVDENMDGDLRNDPPSRLWNHPSDPAARAIIADLQWLADYRGERQQLRALIRIVLESRGAVPGPPSYRAERINTMIGRLSLGGSSHLAFLMDGDGDALYTTDLLDALYVDLDDDRRFEVSPASDEFHPLGVPFALAGRSYQVSDVDPMGGSLALEARDSDQVEGSPQVGSPAPEFRFDDIDGRPVDLSEYRGRWVIVYFWATWCGGCTHQAPLLRSLYERYHSAGLEVVGISFDVDRDAVASFRTRHGIEWPTSYSGRMFWEDPVGQAYHMAGAGVAFLVDPGGRIEGRYGSVELMAARIEAEFAG